MAELTVAMTYGNALFEAAKDLNMVHEIRDTINMIEEVFQDNPDFYELLNSPSLSSENKKNLIKDVFKERINDEVINFLYILIDKRRTTELSRIVRIYEQLVNRVEGFDIGIIYSVSPLSDKQIFEFEEQTGQLLKERVKLNNEIDESLTGGIRILIEGKETNASLKGRLNKLYHQIRNY